MATAAPVKASALERAIRTFKTGIGIDIGVAVAMALLAWLPDADISNRTAWLILAGTLVKTILQAAASYVVRLKSTPKQEAPVVDGAYLVTDIGERVPATPKSIDAYVKDNV